MNHTQGTSSTSRWLLSRRVVALGLVGIAGSCVAGLVNFLIQTLASESVMNLGVLNAYIAVWIAAQTLVTLANVPAARMNAAGRPTAYFFVCVQALFMAGLLHLFGTMATPLVAIVPGLVIVWTLLLDEWLGVAGLAVMVIAIAAIGALEAGGVLAYAPVLLERSIDAQRAPAWFIAVFFHILVLMLICLSLCVLALRSRRRHARELRTANDSLQRANRLIRRYVPTQLAEQILSGDYHEDARPRRRRLTIVFSDVEGFTAASEALDAPVIEAVLNRYLAEMVEIADRHGGTVNQIVGDGIMFFFGAPYATNDRDHALRAVSMARDMQRRVGELGQLWAEQGWDRPFRIRIGINTGEASVGDFGSAGRKLYSGIGLQTNLAERIQLACEPGRILINHSTWQLVHHDVSCVSRGRIVVKGVRESLDVFEVGVASAEAGLEPGSVRGRDTGPGPQLLQPSGATAP